MRSYIKITGLLFLFAGIVLVSLALFLPRLLDVNAYRDEIIASLQESLKRKVSFSSGHFSWHFGPSFDFDGIVIKERDGATDFLRAERITIRLALLPLLEKRAELRDMSLEGADVRLERGGDGALNIDDLLKPGAGGGMQVNFSRIQLRRSTVRWRDAAVAQVPLIATASNINLTFDHVARGRKGTFKISCEVGEPGAQKTHLSAGGTVKLPAAGTSLLDTELNGDAEIKQADIGRFWPYYGRYIPFDNSGGRLDIATTFKGRPREFVAKGKLRISGAAVTWPKIFHYTVAPRSLQLDYDLRLNAKQIDIPVLELSTDGFRIKGSFQMLDYLGKDPRIVAKGVTPGTFRYEDVRAYVPYGLIEKDTSDYIEHKIKAGVFKLDTGVLDGLVSQIAHMELGENYNTLFIRGPVEKAVLSYGPKAPEFKNIKGVIELKGKNFNLIGMSGSFGASPFKMNGSITEYNTDKQSDYPVHMEITPQSGEIAWLAKIAGASKLDFSGASNLVLNGSGHHTAYRLTGDWELKQALYTYPGAIRKPAGMANHLSFSAVIGHGETRLTSVAYSLPPLSLSGNALLRYGGQPYLGFELQTNQFALSDPSPLLPRWQQYHPRGKVQAHILGNGNPEDFSAMSYSGTIGLNGFAFQPSDTLKPLSGISGSITFRGNSLETSSMMARYGSSLVTVKGRVKSLQHPEAELTLTSPQLYLSDVKLAPAASDLVVKRLHADLSIKNDTYLFKSVAGQFRTSNFNVSGTYSGGAPAEANLTVVSSNLNLDDLLLLANQSGQEQAAAPHAGVPASPVLRPDLKLKLLAEAGSYGRLPFTKLNAVIHQDSGVMYLQALDAGVFGGHLTAKGRIAPGNGSQGDRYDLNFSLSKVNADRFFQALELSREITGSLNLSGDVTARGANLADIKKTALGNIRLSLEKGTLRKFSVLSKMFSILNVSQLLKFQLPDMVSGGMPYNHIRGSFAVSDGTIATQDLFISSDAINVSVIGKADLVRENLDFTIGVQPLQTVDKIVNRIPVVGWLLTGKDKAVVTAYFEAKGKWSDPKVTAIPVKAMTKGALGIFRRVFELPVRLFTDTGEVILGQ